MFFHILNILLFTSLCVQLLFFSLGGCPRVFSTSPCKEKKKKPPAVSFPPIRIINFVIFTIYFYFFKHTLRSRKTTKQEIRQTHAHKKNRFKMANCTCASGPTSCLVSQSTFKKIYIYIKAKMKSIRETKLFELLPVRTLFSRKVIKRKKEKKRKSRPLITTNTIIW